MATPRLASSALSNCVTSALQPPQDVAALVAVLREATVVQPASIAAHKAPLLTLLQEQICAVIGKAAAPRAVVLEGSPPSVGAIISAGSSGSFAPSSIIDSQTP